MMHLIGGAVAMVFLVIKAIANDGWDRKFGLWIGLLCGIGLFVGGYLMSKEAGDLPQALGGKGGSTPPAA
jgi:hypothetical protein